MNEATGSDAREARRRCVIFVALVFAISSIFYYLILSGRSFGALVIPLMWCPAVAGFITSFVTKRPLRAFGWRLGAGKWLACGYLFPLLYAVPAYVLVWSVRLGGFPNRKSLGRIRELLHLGAMGDGTTVVVWLVFVATAGVVIGLMGAVGEEIGWRGFFVPELTKWLGFRRAALVSGVVWALWHVPLIAAGPYAASGTPRWYQVCCFVAMVMAIAVAFAWVRMRSGSVWPAAVFHSSHNSFVQSFFDALTVDTGRTHYLTGEFGIAMVPFALLLGIYCWRKGIVTAETGVTVAAGNR